MAVGSDTATGDLPEPDLRADRRHRNPARRHDPVSRHGISLHRQDTAHPCHRRHRRLRARPWVVDHERRRGQHLQHVPPHHPVGGPPAYSPGVETPPRSDEEIAAARIGPPELLDGPVTLTEYDPAWPATDAREEARPRGARRERPARGARRIDLGAGPGRQAPIDIVLAVADSADEAAYVGALEAAGYVLHIREPDWYEHRLFTRPELELNLHVFSLGCAEIERMLRFRDHLRRDDADRRCTKRPSASWRGAPGGTPSTTPTPRPPSSRKSSVEPARDSRAPDGLRPGLRRSDRRGRESWRRDRVPRLEASRTPAPGRSRASARESPLPVQHDPRLERGLELGDSFEEEGVRVDEPVRRGSQQGELALVET